MIYSAFIPIYFNLTVQGINVFYFILLINDLFFTYHHLFYFRSQKKNTICFILIINDLFLYFLLINDLFMVFSHNLIYNMLSTANYPLPTVFFPLSDVYCLFSTIYCNKSVQTNFLCSLWFSNKQWSIHLFSTCLTFY